jgi:hypothetical protein
MENQPHWLEPLTPCAESPIQHIEPGNGELCIETPLHNPILAAKNEIDTIAPVGQWDDAKKITNPFEYIFLSLQRRQHRSIAAIAPLSRSYFKMIELWHILNLGGPDKPRAFMTSHTAEGPGGFLEAIQECTGHQTPMIAMTLRSTERTVPGWRKSHAFLMQHPAVKILYGPDDTGNLYHLCNQDVLAAPGPFADIYTADGGFDFSTDYNGQENLVHRLLAAEIYAGLRTLKVGAYSTMIIKVFDTKNRATLELIWMLSTCFDRAGFVKPNTSRPANSERYWVGRGYRDPPAWVLDLLRRLTATDAPQGWNHIFADPPPWPESWLEGVRAFQTELEHEQLKKIQLTLNLIKATNRDQIRELLLTNIRNSRIWCQTFGIPLNERYAGFSDEAITSQNLEEALIPFQASVARTDLQGSFRQSQTPRALIVRPPLQPPTVGAWKSALPPSVLGRGAS